MQEQTISLENEWVKYDLSSKGGLIKQATLKNFTMQDRVTPVSLFGNEADYMDFAIAGKQDNVVASELLMEPVNASKDGVTFRLAMGEGHIDFAYQLQPESYMLNLEIKAEGVAKYFNPSTQTLTVSLHEKAKQLEKGYTFENRYSTLTYQDSDGDTHYLDQSGNDSEDSEEPLDWVAFKNQFFSCAFIAGQTFGNAKLYSNTLEQGSGFLKEYDVQANTAFDPTGKQPTQMQFYFGPNHFQTLQAHNDLSVNGKDLELEELVDLGWPLFRWINRFITLYIFDWLKGWGLNMGIVLLIMTLILNIFLYPLRLKSFLSSAKMRVLKPKVDEINAKYPNQEDQMRKQQEVMKVYS
ncbi:MAG: YidC/Oxa1 family insertase periplasmic-domain containing protein, partial [Bacteroidaceae bacterium]|nr:YidC/Oxa1 family insertase periplasmic-domain containing protein [Bacteroidaceae bacterium]